MKHGRSELNQRYPLTNLLVSLLQRHRKLEGALDAFVEQVVFLLTSVENKEVRDGEISKIRQELEALTEENELAPGPQFWGRPELSDDHADGGDPQRSGEQLHGTPDGFSRPGPKRR